MPLSLVDTAPRAITIEGYAPRSDEDLAFLHNVVGPDYFRTLRIPIVAGREFTRRDDGEAAPAVDCQRDPGAADVANAGERHRQTPASRHR